MKIALVNLPWYHANRPCMPIATLAPYLRQELDFVDLHVHSDNVKMWNTLGEPLFMRIADQCFSVGEVLYGVNIHPEKREEGLDYVAAELGDVDVGPYLLNHQLYQGKPKTWRTTADLIATLADHQLVKLAESFVQQKYDVIGMTTTFGQLFANLRLAELVKERDPSVKIIIGGSSVSSSVGPTLLKYYADIDYVVQGEGELPFTALLKSIHEGTGDLDKIPGVLTRDNYEFYPKGANLSEVKNMDDLPFPDFDGLIDHCFETESFSVDPLLTLESSRGCWWDRVKTTGNVKKTCHFCNLNVQWNGYKEKSVDRVASEIEMMAKKYGVGRILFIDNIVRLRGVEDLADKLEDLGLDLNFFYEMRANISPFEFMRLWESGLRRCQVGIESLSNSYLRRIGKGTTVIQNLQMMKLCAELHVSNESNIMWNFPGGTAEEVTETIEVIEKYANRYQPLALAKFHLGIGSTVEQLRRQYPIKNIRNFDSYSHFLPDDIYENGKFFDLSFDWDGEQVDWQPVLAAAQKWRNDFYQRGGLPTLSYSDMGDRLRIYVNEAKRRQSFTLDGIAAEIYRFCMQIRRLDEIEERFANRIQPHSILGLLEEWTQLTYMYRDKSRFLSLATAYDPNMAKSRIHKMHLQDQAWKKHKKAKQAPESVVSPLKVSESQTQA